MIVLFFYKTNVYKDFEIKFPRLTELSNSYTSVNVFIYIYEFFF